MFSQKSCCENIIDEKTAKVDMCKVLQVAQGDIAVKGPSPSKGPASSKMSPFLPIPFPPPSKDQVM